MYSIYCCTNKINNKSYVGLTSKLEERWKNHIRDSIRKCSRFFAFQAAIAKYGADNFTWQVIEEHDDIGLANEAEEFLISYLETITPNGYNIKRGGNNHHPTQETKNKISETLKKTSWFIGRKGPAHPNFGRKITDKEKENLRQKFSGENAALVKLTTDKVVSIYQEYLDDNSIYPSDLASKYNMSKNAIRNILKKKCWKQATAHLVDIDLKIRARSVNAKINTNTAKKIKLDIRNKLGSKSKRQITFELADKYNTSVATITGIMYNRNWKHITID